ncbi:MAG TPA: hypothetical protein VMJ75_02205 [Candidatus Acidoferrales bacterium]|nr:hypothetical protein [Candidatus Acidoferrales bacterium]
MQYFGKTRLFLAFALLAATPLIAHLRTRHIGDLAEHAKESLGKSVWVDGCVTSQGDQGKIFQLNDGTGAISVLAAGEVPTAGACMELNGVVRFQDSRYMLEERERKIH